MRTLPCLIFVSVAAWASVDAADTNPIAKVVQLLSDLETKIVGEGADAQKVYDEFAKMCWQRSKDLGFDIKTGKDRVAELKAAIAQEANLIASLNGKIEDLSASIATDEADLAAATSIREKEAADFAAEKAELNDIINTLQRAIGILEREMAKSGASMLQLQGAAGITEALAVMVKASMLSTADSTKLTAFVQQKSQDDDTEPGAPDAAVYKGHSGGIIDTLNGLLDEAEGQLADAQKKETSALHNFELLKQSLDDSIKYSNKELSEARSNLAASGESKSTAEGELAMTSKALAEDTEALADLHHECMTGAETFEAETKSRDEELKALATAKKIINDGTGASEKVEYGLAQVSFLQLASGADLAGFEAVRLIRDLARKQHLPMMAQLASRMASTMRQGSGEDVFAKVKGLISDMIEKLEAEAEEDATEKAFCDKELAENRAKKADKTARINALTAKIDQATARKAELEGDVAALQKALAALAATQAEMDKVRQEENALFVKTKAELEQGIEAVKLALKVLREYYAKDDKAHVAADGAASGIVSLIEVIESDLTKGLADATAAEEAAAAEYTKVSNENEVDRATKEQDVKYKQKEIADLTKALAEASDDRAGLQDQLDAINKVLEGLEARCIAKAETYEERVRRRDAELAGLKQALDILENEAALLQKGARKSLRVAHRH